MRELLPNRRHEAFSNYFHNESESDKLDATTLARPLVILQRDFGVKITKDNADLMMVVMMMINNV